MKAAFVLGASVALGVVAACGGVGDRGSYPHELVEDSGSPSLDGGTISRDAGPDADALADAKSDVDTGPPLPACARTVPDPKIAARASCSFAAGARVADTLGLDAATRATLPIKHLIVVVQENRSFDHYFGQLHANGQPDAEAIPTSFKNPDKRSVNVSPFALSSACLPFDPPHQGWAMQTSWDNGTNDGFVRAATINGQNGTDGHYVMGLYGPTDLPFYYFLANTYSIADRYFASALAGTWGNRDYLYAATSDGVTDTGQRAIHVPTIFDQLETAGVPYGVYTDGLVRQDCIGWSAGHPNEYSFADLITALGNGTLPPVAFVDPGPSQDEHPPANINVGEKWMRYLYEAAIASPHWKELAILFTYDESGGLADHVLPPTACLAAPSQSAFDHLGFRVPMMVISPWAAQHRVSHVVHDHTSILRLIQAMHDLPALTGRDANADALLDMFDFGCPPLLSPPTSPDTVIGTCN